MSTSIVILAAGNGSRMNFQKCPKVYQPVAELPILGHIIGSCMRANVAQIITVLKPNDKLERLPERYRNVDIAYQAVAKGSGDAVLQALPKANTDTVLVLYGDTPLITADTIQNVINNFEKSNSDVSDLAVETNKSGYGRLLLDNENVIKIIEACDLEQPNSNLCNVGIIFKKDIAEKLLPQLKERPSKHEIFLTDLIAIAYKQKYKTGYILCDSEEMYGINTLQDLAYVSQLYQQQRRYYFMQSGVRLIAPETVFFAYDTVIESDVVIYPYVVFGPGVIVRKNAVIQPFTHLEGAVIDAAIIGPFARLRPGAKIDSGAKIGNFVEIKNSAISSKSKVNHLSYIGDSSIGEETNIGAGCITCNYDGFSKHKTIIGNNVFVGSQSCFIAPVTIENGALIAAGSVVVNQVDKDDICIARAEQKNIHGAAKRFREKKKCVE